MKKHLLLAFLASGFGMQLRAQIPNNDLENWLVKSYDAPGGAFTHAFGKVTKTSDKHNGSYAVKVQGNTNSGQPGGLGIGEFDNGPTLSHGYPFAAKPDSLIFWAKTNLASNDTAYVYLSFFKAGNRISNQWFKLAGPYTNYTRVAYKIDYTVSGQTPDSITLLFGSTNLFGSPNAASYVIIDDVSFAGTALNIPNAGFENWSTTTHNVPKDWWNPYEENDLFDKSPALFDKTNDKATGEYAIVVQNTFNAKDSIWGQTQTGSDNMWGWPAFPVSGKQDTLYGLFKWFPDKKDSWSVYIMMYKNHKICGGGNIVGKDSQITYAIFKFPINYYNSDIPDSAVIQLSSYGPNGAKGNSKLYIDNLNFNHVYGVGTDPISKKNTFIVYPNPAQDMLTLVLTNTAQKSVFSIINTSGVKVKEITCSDEFTRISIQDLAAGTYFVVQNEGGAVTRFVKK